MHSIGSKLLQMLCASIGFAIAIGFIVGLEALGISKTEVQPTKGSVFALESALVGILFAAFVLREATALYGRLFSPRSKLNRQHSMSMGDVVSLLVGVGGSLGIYAAFVRYLAL